MSDVNYTEQLQKLMQNVEIDSFNTLCCVVGISRRQLLKIRKGEVKQVKIETLINLSKALNITLDSLIRKLSDPEEELEISNITVIRPNNLNHISEESKQLQEIDEQKFQQFCLEILESLLLQFPTAAHKARENPQLAAINILPLVERPLERLLQAWGIEAIAQVGEEVFYNPQLHQAMEGNISPNQIVKVRYVGYQQRGKLLYRAKVSSIISK
jgi:transcriptional regulator with XRE-family HTH domain